VRRRVEDILHTHTPFEFKIRDNPQIRALALQYFQMEDPQPDSQEIVQETPAQDVSIAPSISPPNILSGESYTYHSPIPETITDDMSIECVLGVDEAGRGPVLGINAPFSTHLCLTFPTISRSHGICTTLPPFGLPSIPPRRNPSLR